MGSVGDAYDNAICESFFATLECELLDRRRFASQVEGRISIRRSVPIVALSRCCGASPIWPSAPKDQGRHRIDYLGIIGAAPSVLPGDFATTPVVGSTAMLE